MSTTIDQRVVEMQFDNRHFEQNVSQTMSTLDKLKQKLHLPGASKGLEDVGNAARKVDMSPLGNSVENVRMRFSALEVMGVTALANITNSAVNAGKRIISALTIDPIKTGFQEYETQINAVQTILANTSSKGTTIDDVNVALDELNKYADMTIYNFTEMTRNIGTFTAAGIDLDTSVNAIQGIANLAAVSGSTSQQASTAMYQLSQALASGTVKLMDWNSVVNAGMGGQVFQDALKKTSEELGTGAEAAIKASGSFRESLKDGWLTADVLTATLKKFTSSGANEYVAEYTSLSVDAVEAAIKDGEAAAAAAKARGEEVDAIDHAAEALAKKSGKNKDEIKDALQFAKTATDAATKVKTFTQLWDVLKESAQSGWSQTWKIIVGDFEEAKELLTPLADTLTGFINKMSDVRNRILQVALDFTSPWTTMMEKLNGSGLGKIKEMAETVTNLGDKLEYYQNVVSRVWRGDYKNADTGRFEKLEAEGYDHRVVQDLVNKGYQYKLTVEDIEASHKKFGLTMEKGTEETKEATKSIEKLSDSTLKNAGFTEEEIRLYRALESEADRLGISVNELAEEMSNTNGRDLLIESFKNIGDIFVGTGKAIKEAWVEIFNPPSLEVFGIRLYGVIKSIKDFTESLRLTNKDTGELNDNGLKVQRTLKGIFAALDIVLTVVGGPLKIAFKLLTQLLGAFGFNILDVTAFVGDMLVKFRDFIDGALDFSGVFEKIANPIKSALETFKKWIASLKESENLPQDIALGIASGFGKAFTAIKNFFKKLPEYFSNGFADLKESPLAGFIAKLKGGLGVAGETIAILGDMIREKIKKFLSRSEFAGISADSIAGLVNGFKDGASNVWNAAVETVTNLVQKVKDFLGIESPSKVFFAIGGFIIAGLIAGLQNGIPDSLGAIKDVFQPMLDWIKNIDFGAVFAGIIGIGTTATVYKGVDGISSLFGGLGDLFAGTGEVLSKSAKPIAKVIKSTTKVVKSFSKVLDSFSKILSGIAFSIKLDAIGRLAESLGKTLLMLVGAIAILTFFEPAELWNAVGVVAVLAVIMVGLAFAMDKLSSTSASFEGGKLDIKGLSSGLTGIGIAILLIAATVKMIGSMDPEQAKQGFLGLAGLVVAIGLVIAAFGLLVKGKAVENIDKFGKTITKLAIAFLLMALVAKILGGMDQATLIQGGIAIAAFSAIMVGLMAATKLISGSKNVESIGATLLKIALAIGVMALVAKFLAGMEPGELIKGGLAITAFGGIIVGLMAATKLITGSKNVDKIGSTLLKIALAIGVMAIVAKMLGSMEPGALLRGGLAITAFGGIIVGLMAATKLVSGSKNIDKIGGAILAVSGAIAIMAFTAFLLSMVSWEGFAKGTIMVTVFAGIIVGLIAATKLVGNNADKISKTIITIAAAIAALGLVAVLLSLVPVENLKKGITAVAALSAIMAVLIAVTKLAQNCMGTVIAITAAIAVLAGALYLLSTVPSESLLPAVLALGGMLLVMTGVLAALGFIGKMAKDAALGAFALATLAVPLALFGLVLAMMSALKVADAIPNAIALSVLCTVLTSLLGPLSIIGFLLYTTGGIILLGVAALALMAVPLVAFVGIIALMSGIQNGIANAMALTTLMAVIGDVLLKVSLVAPLVVIGVAAITAMIGLMTALGLLATAIGALVTQFPQLQTFLDTGLTILEQLANGLGRIIGSFIAGFAGEVMTILPQLGLCLSQFMLNATAFIVGAKMVDESVLAGVGILAGAIIALTAADLITGVVSFLQGGSSFADLGTQLSNFMINALPFITTAALITPEMMSGVKALAETILILTAADVIQGLTSFLTGGSSLESFAAQLPILGQGLAAFSASLGAFTEDQLSTVNCAAQAIKTLAQASSEIPNSGGLLAQIVGENDLGTFADQFPELGSGLRDFIDSIGTFSEAEMATVNSAAQAVKTLAQASSEIPNSGGWLAQIVGDNNLDTFADQFPELGSGLRDFIDNIGTFSEAEMATVNSAAQAVKTLAQVSSEIPNSGGLLAQIVGDNNLGTFADQFPDLGSGLRDFVNNIGTFSEAEMATVESAASAVKSLASVAQSIPNTGGLLAGLVGDNDLGTFALSFPKVGEGIKGFTDKLGTFDAAKVNTVQAGVNAVKAISGLASVDLAGLTSNLDAFGSEVVLFGSSLARFCEKLPPAADLDGAIEQMNKIIDVTKSLGSVNSEVWGTLADNLKKVGENAVNKFVGAFTSKTAKTDLKEAAEKLGDRVVDGIEAKEKAVKTAGEDAAKEAVAGVRKQYDKMKSAGKDLGKGLVQGIEAKWDDAYDAGFTLGKKAVQGEKAGQQSESPSKLTIQAGKWLGEGLIIGIGKMGSKAYSAGYALGETATKSISSSISRISDMINTDIDSQPTIRPVLDLSNVKSGTSLLSDMLSMDSSVGVSANVGAISSMMSMRSQNGGNDDIISELAKLRKDIGNISNTTYQVNGVTYDDGSNVANAVGTLARAIRIERRV